MKKIYFNISCLAVAFMMVVAGCATSGGASESNSEGTSETIVNDPSTPLSMYLQKIPGVQVIGSGNNISIKIRGASSFMTSSEPLYVIDGIPVGNSYLQADRMVNLHYVSSIRVLKGSDASIYGVRGGNGVIMIETRKGQ